MLDKILQRLTNAFPVWVLSASILAMFFPELFTWFTGNWITYGLGIIMLGMGLTLKLEDFQGVLKYPLWIGTGIALQYTVMPLLGWALGYVFQLPTPLAAGLVLVACCPGGTASNVISFLAKANVALSVTMTAVSTVLAALMTPTLTALLVGSRLEVSVLGLFLGTVKVVLVPVAIGVLLNHYLPQATKQLLPYSPLVAVLVITLIVASVIGASRELLLDSGLQLLGAVWSLHLLGFGLGYVISYVLFKQKLVSRTISIEVGMQNSGLGVVLARGNFTDPATAIPSALSSLTHCLIGSFVAALWRRDDRQILLKKYSN